MLLPAFVRRPHTPTHYVLDVEIGRRPTAQCGPGWVINLEFQILVKDETDTIYGMEFLIEFSRTSLTGQTSHEKLRKSCHSLLGCGGQKTVCVARYIRQCLGPIDSILRRSAAGVASCKEVLGLMRARRATEEAYGQALLRHCLIGATPDADRTRHSCV